MKDSFIVSEHRDVSPVGVISYAARILAACPGEGPSAIHAECLEMHAAMERLCDALNLPPHRTAAYLAECDTQVRRAIHPDGWNLDQVPSGGIVRVPPEPVSDDALIATLVAGIYRRSPLPPELYAELNRRRVDVALLRLGYDAITAANRKQRA